MQTCRSFLCLEENFNLVKRLQGIDSKYSYLAYVKYAIQCCEEFRGYPNRSKQVKSNFERLYVILSKEGK